MQDPLHDGFDAFATDSTYCNELHSSRLQLCEIRWTEYAQDHIAAHSIAPQEVEQVVNTRPRLVLNGRDETEYVFGTTSAGRYLLVVLTEALDGREYVVTDREMTNAERQTFRRKGR